MFGEYGQDYFSSMASFLMLIPLFFILLWLYSLFVESRLAKGTTEKFKPVGRWYSRLPFNVRKVLGIATFIIYCVASFLFIVYTSS